jgi:hypothetical protein
MQRPRWRRSRRSALASPMHPWEEELVGKSTGEFG